jgi:hypothetical protein
LEKFQELGPIVVCCRAWNHPTDFSEQKERPFEPKEILNMNVRVIQRLASHICISFRDKTCALSGTASTPEHVIRVGGNTIDPRDAPNVADQSIGEIKSTTMRDLTLVRRLHPDAARATLAPLRNVRGTSIVSSAFATIVASSLAYAAYRI